MTVLADLAAAIRGHRGDSREEALRLVEQALTDGVPAHQIVHDGLVPAMTEVGRRFRENEIFVPEVLMSARAMQGALDVLAPELERSGHEPVGRFVIGTVKGDIHDIGKSLVTMLLRGAGFSVIDLGVDVSLEAFDRAIDEHRPDIVGMSALLTTTMGQMQQNLDAWNRNDRRPGFAVMVGGAPVTEEWAREIGADGFAPDAASAVEVATSLVRPRGDPTG